MAKITQRILSFRDNSEGIWGELLFGKQDPKMILHLAFFNPKLYSFFADEIISSVKGGAKHSFKIFRRNGKLKFVRYITGSYPYGIKKGISPDGSPYEPLSEATIRHREWKYGKSKFAKNKNIQARGGSFILRETSQHIFHGIKILNKVISENGAVFEIGWGKKNENIVLKQNNGFNTGSNRWFGKKPKHNVKVVARPFIGIQKQCITNLKNTFSKIIK